MQYRDSQKGTNFGPEFPYNRTFMRVLTIIAGLLAVASLCPAQVTPATAETPAVQTDHNPVLQQQLEDLKIKYGKAQIDPSQATEVVLKPKPGRQTLNLSGDSRSIYNGIANAFGVRATFDESVPSRTVRFTLSNVDFRTATDTAALMTRTFWIPVASDEFMVAADNPQKRKELEPMLERTFYLPDTITATDLQDVVNLVRTIFEVRYIVQQPTANSITVRAEQRKMHDIERLLSQLDMSRPVVMLDIEAVQVNSSMQRQLGINMPLQFQMFNIPAGVLELLAVPGIQDILQQIAQGGLSGANSNTVAALLGQYQNQLQTLLANPIATFGGGLTFMGISVPPMTANFSRNESRARVLEKLTLQASQGNPATLHIGNRYPVITQSFSSGINVTGLNIGVVGAIPGFTYEDLGVSLKAKPTVHGTSAVTIDAELSIKSLAGQSLNGNPVILNREYKGAITVKDGEPAVIAGVISKTEQKSLSGPPGIGSLPVLNKLLENENTTDDRTELVIIVTPHITRTKRTQSPAFVASE